MSQPPKTPNVTHHTVNPKVAYAGKQLVVRDKDWGKVWGVNLEYAEAHKLKNKIAGSGKSRTVMYEEMPTDPVLLEKCAGAEIQGTGSTPAADAADDAAIEALDVGPPATAPAPAPAPKVAVPVPTAPAKPVAPTVLRMVAPTPKVVVPVAPAAPAAQPDISDEERARLITTPPPPPVVELDQPAMSDVERARLITQGPAPVAAAAPELPAAQSDVDEVTKEVFAGVTSQVEVDNRLMKFVSTCGEYGIRAVPGSATFAGGAVELEGWTFTIAPDEPMDSEGAELDNAALEDIVGG